MKGLRHVFLLVPPCRRRTPGFRPGARRNAGQAADKVKVGFVSTLSGPSSALGVDIRDGFLLA